MMVSTEDGAVNGTLSGFGMSAFIVFTTVRASR